MPRESRRASLKTLAVAGLACSLFVFVNDGLLAEEYKTVPVLKGDPYAQSKPNIEHVRATSLGYVIVGLGFGGNPASLRVLENGVGLPANAIVGASAQRISVHSIPASGTPTSVVVEVDGSQSSPYAFSYSKPLPVPVPELEDAAEIEDVEGAQETAARKPLTIPDLDRPESRPNDVAREVIVLRRRVEALEQEIYELKKAMTSQ